MIQWFWDEQLGAFFDTAQRRRVADHAPARRQPTTRCHRELRSRSSCFCILSELTHDTDMRRRATFVLETMATPLIRYPSAFGHLLGAADMAHQRRCRSCDRGRSSDEKGSTHCVHEVATHYVPSLVLAGGVDTGRDRAAATAARRTRGQPTAYVCRSYACDEPVTDPQVLASAARNRRTHRHSIFSAAKSIDRLQAVVHPRHFRGRCS